MKMVRKGGIYDTAGIWTGKSGKAGKGIPDRTGMPLGGNVD